MEFNSILGRANTWKKSPNGQPDCFVDLNLDQIINKIQECSPDYPVKELFYKLPQNADINYRQEIYADIKQTQVYEAFVDFSANIRRSAEKEQLASWAGEAFQKACWYVEEVYFYGKAITDLKNVLKDMVTRGVSTSQGLAELTGFLEAILQEESFHARLVQVNELWEQISNLRFTLEIEGNKIRIIPQEQGGNYEDFLGECFGKYGTPEKGSMHSPFAAATDYNRLEAGLLEAYFHKYPTLERKIMAFSEKKEGYKHEKVLQLEKEVQLYLAYYGFQMKCQEQGAVFTRPVFHDKEPMYAKEVYDLALALVNYEAEKPVVSNDFSYQAQEQFFVISGANQGGKTTFARSLGQLVYLGLLGLDVNAKEANLYCFNNVITHFSVEESAQSGQGKLMEELERLSPIMRGYRSNTFVVINELFTTAAHYDGCIMGTKVLDHFMKDDCYGIYVTHLRDFGKDKAGVVCMAAMLEEGESHKRTYKIARSESHIYGYAEDIVKKYGLGYDKLSEKLADYQTREGGWNQC